MASPFKVFRKNATILMVGLVILSMGGFVVLPSLLQILGGGGGGQSPTAVVVRTNRYGNLTEQDLRTLQGERLQLRRFFQLLAESVAAKQGDYMTVLREVDRLSLGQTDEQGCVDAWLLAQKAKELGLRISDEAINTYITELATSESQKLTIDDVVDVLQRMGLSEGRLFYLLRRELAAALVRDQFYPSLGALTPVQRWDYFLRLRQKARIELCGVEVDEFLDQVPAPSESELREYFEEHKLDLPLPNSPEPGFRVPNLITVQYLKADIADWVNKIQPTEEEIRAYYEEHKDEKFLAPLAPEVGNSSLPVSESELLGTGTESRMVPVTPPAKSGDAESTENSPPTGDDATSEEEEGSNPVDAAGTEDVSEEDADDAGNDNASSGEAEKEPAQPSATPETPAADEQSSNVRTPIRFVSLQEDDESADASNDEKSSQSDAPDAAQSDDSSAGEETPSEPAQETSSGQVADGNSAEDGSAPAAEPSTSPEGEQADLDSAENDSETASNPKYRPLEEVRDEIITDLARTKMSEAIKAAESAMSAYREKWLKNQEDIEKAKEEDVPEDEWPAEIEPLDLEVLARDLGLIARKLPPMARWELAEIKGLSASNTEDGRGFLDAVFGSQRRLYLPIRTTDQDYNIYVSWVVDRVEDHVPKFEDEGVRERVLEAWKRKEARIIAERTAQEFADKANESNQSLREVVPADRKDNVAESEPFSWYTYGDMEFAWLQGASPWFDQIVARVKDPASGLITTKELVDSPGDKFMESVFSLEVGKAGVAWNQPETVVYAVRLLELAPPAEELADTFLSQNVQTYYGASRNEFTGAFRKWYDLLREEAGLKWERPPITTGE